MNKAGARLLSMRFKFFKTIILLSVLLALVLVYPLYAWAEPHIVRAIIAAAGISLVNTVIGMLLLEYSIDKATNIFMGGVFGGMMVRMAFVLVAVTWLLLEGYHPLSFALALMGFYSIFLITEIVYVVRELSRRKIPAQVQTHITSRNIVPRTITLD